MKGSYFSKNIVHKRIMYNLYISLLVITVISCSKSNTTPLEVGGFTFGSSKQEALNIAKTLGYDIELNGEYHLYLTGGIQALDTSWDIMDICVDSVNGVKEIRLTRRNSLTSREIKNNVFNAITKQFPKSERKVYVESLTGVDTNTGKTSTIKSDFATLFELIDERDEYSGASYYILSSDEFSTSISMNHTKAHLNISNKR